MSFLLHIPADLGSGGCAESYLGLDGPVSFVADGPPTTGFTPWIGGTPLGTGGATGPILLADMPAVLAHFVVLEA